MTSADHLSLSPMDGLSHVRGPASPELARSTIPELLGDAVARFGDRDAFVFREAGLRLTYAEFAARVDRLAAGLLALGLEPGDRVGIWSPNRFEWILTQFATARAGMILVNINPAYRLSELEYALSRVGCAALIAAKSFKNSDYQGMIQSLIPELAGAATGGLRAPDLPELRHVILMDPQPAPGMLSFDAVCDMGGQGERAALDRICAGQKPDDPINVQFTSGTTGMPKGATLSHLNIVNNARFVTGRINLTQTDRLVIPVPLYHCFGMVMGVLGGVSKGAAMIFPGEAFDPSATLDAVAEEGGTALYGVPTMFVAMLNELDARPRDLSSLRTGIMAGAPCPIDIMRRVNDQMNMREVTICYGMTETSPVSFQSFTDDPTQKRCETVGRIHPHLQVKIVDANGHTVPVGEKGELCTSGYSVMIGYWGDDAATRGSIRDGWMHTGDLATLDEDGFCAIVGRVKDMIIRGGENIYPREIEEFLFRHPKISEVQVFGIPDAKYGEEICVWAVARPGTVLKENELRDFCKDKIAHFKIPKHVRIVSELPMTVTGKPQKFVMRDRMIEELSK
ncbi:AMP-binding protein [Paracoccus sp. (in: a-proteobacteria)]|uniref:AMP-binding protein n=1 Tax=Paracoccus sp. TaxID=267 RepID=UPI003A85927A